MAFLFAVSSLSEYSGAVDAAVVLAYYAFAVVAGFAVLAVATVGFAPVVDVVSLVAVVVAHRSQLEQ